MPRYGGVVRLRHPPGHAQDPQLRYYWQKGFKTIVACKPDYFPHAASLDYGVVVRGASRCRPWRRWRHVPLPWLRGCNAAWPGCCDGRP